MQIQSFATKGGVTVTRTRTTIDPKAETADLIQALDSLYDARIPIVWLKKSWEAATLGSWFTGLVARHAQLDKWVNTGRPKSYWLTGFFNPSGFLTASRQEVCRAHSKDGWALDDCVNTFEVLKQERDDVKAALVGIGFEPQEALNQVAWESVLGSPVREVWAHDGKCACRERTYLFGQCPSCIRQEVGERALADQEAREAAQVDVLPEDGVPAVDLVGAVSGSSVSHVLLVKPRQVVAWSHSQEPSFGPGAEVRVVTWEQKKSAVLPQPTGERARAGLPYRTVFRTA
jgi:hypothetical protein